jgi:hypothetical protein
MPPTPHLLAFAPRAHSSQLPRPQLFARLAIVHAMPVLATFASSCARVLGRFKPRADSISVGARAVSGSQVTTTVFAKASAGFGSPSPSFTLGLCRASESTTYTPAFGSFEAFPLSSSSDSAAGVLSALPPSPWTPWATTELVFDADADEIVGSAYTPLSAFSTVDSFDGSLEKQQSWFTESQARPVSVLSTDSRVDDCDCLRATCTCLADRALPVATFDPAGTVDKAEIPWASAVALGRRYARNGAAQANVASASPEYAAALDRLVTRHASTSTDALAAPGRTPLGPAAQLSLHNLRRDVILRQAATSAKTRRAARATGKTALPPVYTLQTSASDPFRCTSSLGPTSASPALASAPPTSVPLHATAESGMKCVAGGCTPHACHHHVAAGLLDLDVDEEDETSKRLVAR